MFSRRFFIKCLSFASLAGCVNPSRVWENSRASCSFDSEDMELPPVPEPCEHSDSSFDRETRPDRCVVPSGVQARSVWTKAPELKWRLGPMGRIWRITVHHEGTPDGNYSNDYASVVNDLRKIRRAHISRMRAGDIGYHYIIDRRGYVWEGRNIKYQGAHAGGSNNKGNIGVMALGNFDVQRPTEKQLAALSQFIPRLMRTHGVSSRKIYTHRELKVTRCPGTYLQNYMNSFRRGL